MKKLNFVLILILLIVVNINAKSKDKIVVPQDTLSLKMLPSIKHDLQISFANLSKKVYFTDNVSIHKSDFLTKGMSTILNKAMVLTDVSVNGKSITYKEHKNYKAVSFDPIMRVQSYTEIKANCRLYEILYSDVKNLPDTVIVRIKYHVSVEDTLGTILVESKKIDMDGNLFWYPRNLNQNENVKVTVKSTDQVYALLDNQYMKFKQKDYARTFEQEFSDPLAKPVNLSFRISELK